MKTTRSKTNATVRRNLGRIIREADGKTRIAISSETPCPDEVYVNKAWRRCNLSLSHAPEAVDMERIRDGIALKDGHWSETVLARAMDPSIEDGKLVAHDIVWSASDKAQVFEKDFASGVLRDISVEAYFSYADCEVVGDANREVIDVVVRKWTPLCAAFVVNGADPNAGVSREMETDVPDEPETQTKPAEEPAAPAAVETTAREEKKMDPKEIQQVYDLARKFNIAGDTISQWLGEGKTLAECRAAILDEIAERAAKPANAVEIPGSAIPAKDIKRYSVIKAFCSMMRKEDDESKVDAGLERECSREIAHQLGRSPRGLFIPAAVLARDFSSDPAIGGAIIPTEYLGGSFIEKLRSKLVISNLGVRYLPGLVGDVAIPKQTGSVTGYYIDNEAKTGVPESEPTTGLVGLTPRTFGARGIITRKMLKQARNPAADAFVQEDILQVCARGVQIGALYGTGANGQPTGLANSVAKSTAAANFQTIVDMESAIETPNDEENVTFLLNRRTFGRLRLISKDVGSGHFLATRERGAKYVDDIPALTTSDIGANEIFLGDWSQLIIGMWGSVDITINPYSEDARGALTITALQDFDVGIRHEESFKYVEFTNA